MNHPNIYIYIYIYILGRFIKNFFQNFLTILPYFYAYGDKKQCVKFLRDYNDVLLPGSSLVYLGKIAIGRPDLYRKLLKLGFQKLNRSP